MEGNDEGAAMDGDRRKITVELAPSDFGQLMEVLEVAENHGGAAVALCARRLGLLAQKAVLDQVPGFREVAQEAINALAKGIDDDDLRHRLGVPEGAEVDAHMIEALGLEVPPEMTPLTEDEVNAGVDAMDEMLRRMTGNEEKQ